SDSHTPTFGGDARIDPGPGIGHRDYDHVIGGGSGRDDGLAALGSFHRCYGIAQQIQEDLLHLNSIDRPSHPRSINAARRTYLERRLCPKSAVAALASI